MQYVWTQEGVDDYIRRHPDRSAGNTPRKVGEIATYDGKPLEQGDIRTAYLMRGLIKAVDAPKKKKKSSPSRKEGYYVYKQAMKEEQRRALTENLFWNRQCKAPACAS